MTHNTGKTARQTGRTDEHIQQRERENKTLRLGFTMYVMKRWFTCK